MKLPVIPKKYFDVKSKYIQGGKITLSPFTVGLESLLMQVKDSEDESEKMSAISQVIQACVQTDHKVSGIPIFMIEEIFLRLRQNSIGEIIEQNYLCTNIIEGDTTHDDKPCNNVMPINIDLREFVLIEDKEHTNRIIISDPIGIKFRYPVISMFDNNQIGANDDTQTIIACIESIFDATTVFPADEQTQEQLVEFWEQLTLAQKKQVYDKFFTNMPHMQYKKEVVCSKCGFKHEIEFNSVKDVFQS
jgi:hypothetical protein